MNDWGSAGKWIDASDVRDPINDEATRARYRRNMRLQHDDIASKLETITPRIQSKMTDPPQGSVLFAEDPSCFGL